MTIAVAAGCASNTSWPEPTPASERTVVRSGASNAIVLQGSHARGTALVSLHPLTLATTAQPIVVPTRRSGLAPTAQTQQGWIALGVENDNATKVTRWDRRTQAISEIAIPNRHIAAIHALGSGVLFGNDKGVGFVANAGISSWLSHTPHESGQSYGLFARDRDHVIAVDNKSAPFYADIIRVDANGPKSLVTLTLPEVAQGRYLDVALEILDPKHNSGYAYLLSATDLREGRTQVVDRLAFGGEIPTRRAVTAAAAEFSPRDVRIGLSALLLDGNKMTPWSAIGLLKTIVGTKVAIAAGSRGLLISGDPDTQTVSLPGETKDVLVRGKTVYALCWVRKSTVIFRLQWDGSKLTRTEETTLPQRYARFVD